MKKLSIYRQITREQLEEIISKSLSYQEALNRIGLSSSGRTYMSFKQYVKRLKIPTDHFDATSRSKKYTLEELFCENPKAMMSSIRYHIHKHKLVKYICEICKSEPIWLGKKLTLILDHINGNNRDNRLENLRFLCPNCNIQTETFGSKNTHRYANDHINQESSVEIMKEKEEKYKIKILELVKSNRTLESVAAKLGISTMTLRKKCLKFDIDYSFYFRLEHLYSEIILDSTDKQMNIASLAIKYSVSEYLIRKILLANNIDIQYDDLKSDKIKILKRGITHSNYINDSNEGLEITSLFILHRTLSAVSKILRISDNGLKKKCKRLGIDYKFYYNLKHLSADILEEYQKTQSIYKTMATFNTSAKFIKQILLENNIAFKDGPKLISNNQKKQAISMLKKGHKIKEIVEAVKISDWAIKKYKKELGLTKEKKPQS